MIQALHLRRSGSSPAWVGKEAIEAMYNDNTGCVLLAERNQRLSEGVRGLLETTFKVVVMVADEVSLFESLSRLQVDLAIVDLSVARGEGLRLVRRLRDQCPELKFIITGVHDEPSVTDATLKAGANGFVPKSAIATDLLSAVDSVIAGERYRSPAVLKCERSER